MHKCPYCGQEYEGKFCPECGTEWQDEKTCPNCHTKLAGSAKFCNECGHSFTKKTEKNSKIKSKLNAVWLWVKSHLKIVVPVVSAVLLVIILSCSIPACIAAKNDGTYYVIGYDGELNKNEYFIIKSGSWENYGGESGYYELDGNEIIFYSTLFGETTVFYNGTLENYVLKIKDATLICEKHQHSYGEWETTRKATCTVDGLETRTCACGLIETNTIKARGHFGGWSYDCDIHWKICNVCQEKFEIATHDDKTNCSICGYPFKYTLNWREPYDYGIKSCYEDATEAVIPSTFNNTPVTFIDSLAFRNCESLTSITIPDSVTSIGNCAFWNCRSLTSITFKGTKAQWNAIGKGVDWYPSYGNYTVHCTDGDIKKADS